MARLLRSSVIALAVVALCAAWGYSRPIFGQQPETPVAPTAPKAEAAPAKIPEAEEAVKQFQLRNFDGATKKLEEAVAKNPNLPPAHVIMFQWFAQSNQAFLARMALERAVMNEAKDPEAYIIMGNIALQERRVTDAELQFIKAHELLKSFDKSLERKEKLEPNTISGLASVAEARERWSDAQTQLEALLKLNPSDKSMVATAMQRLARAHFQQKRATDALKYLRDAKAKDPENVLTPEAALARFYEQFPDHENAVKWMKLALQKAPDDLATLLVAAQWALETAQLPDADKHATKALQLARAARNITTDANAAQTDARLLSAQILRGLVALFRKDYKTAEQFFEDAHLQSPSNFAASNNLALALCEMKTADGKPDQPKLNRALEYANANYTAKPRDPETASTLGWVLYKAGYKERAEGALRLAASSGNLAPDTAYYLAQVAYDGGSKENKELAKNLLEAALKTTSFSMRPESEALLAKIKAEPPAKEKAKDSKP
jgi:Tfp pilus assembly protein PilF